MHLRCRDDDSRDADQRPASRGRLVAFRRESDRQEAVWIERLADGDRNAFEAIFRAYQCRLMSYLFQFLGSRDAAEEVFNDVMLAVWKGASRFRGSSKPSTWIFGIARHKALNRLGRDRKIEGVDIESAPEKADPHPDAEKRLVSRDLVKRALERLSPDHREVIELTYFSGLSYSEIAEITGCPVNTIKTRMFYARRQLKEAVASGSLKA